VKLEDTQEGHNYRVVAKIQDDGIGYEVMGMLRSKRIRFRGVRHWYFEGPVWEHLIDPSYIEDIEEVRSAIF
jgi:hypothetical protein